MKVKKVNYDNHYTSGCETCDYGSSYIEDIEIILEDGTYIRIKFNQMYKYMLSESDYINIIGMSNDLEDMWSNLFTRLEEKMWGGDYDMYIKLNINYMTVNGEDVDLFSSIKTKKLILIGVRDEITH